MAEAEEMDDMSMFMAESHERSCEVTDFIDIISVIVYYYNASAKPTDPDSSEAWKKDLKGSGDDIVPSDVDAAVKKAFINQLKKYH